MVDDGLDSLGPSGLAEEVGCLRWPELERHFARGVVVVVSTSLDILKVAEAMARNQADQLALWMADGLVWKASDEDAKSWAETAHFLKAIVIAPWVVVQTAVSS